MELKQTTDKINRKMKKVIYGAAALVFAAMMVSCGGKSSTLITKGDKSKLDTLSYAIGSDIGRGITAQMPEMKFDMKAMLDGAETALTNNAVKEDKKHAEAIEVLENFFSMERPKRMQDLMAEIAVDSTKAEQEHDIFTDDKERREISYAYGYDMGTNLRNARIPLQTYWFAEGIEDAKDGEPKLGEEEAYKFIQNYFMIVRPAENAEASEKWLSKIEKKSGVQKTASGLLYRIDKAGDADIKPHATDIVKVDYEGKLKDGTVFDSSYERGEPIEFGLNQVIKGWTEGMQLIGKGGQITLWIPAELGYGAFGQGPIGPNEAMEFKVELLDVKSAETAAETPAETQAETSAETPAETPATK